MEKDDRKKKQIFLRTEVIEKGFDPHNFKVFCDKIKNDGSIIDFKLK